MKQAVYNQLLITSLLSPAASMPADKISPQAVIEVILTKSEIMVFRRVIMSKIKMFSAAVLSILLIASTFGCSKSSSTTSNSTTNSMTYSGEKATITFWHTYGSNTEAKVFNDNVVPDFNKKYPNITVKAITMPTDNLKQQILQAAASGSSPDVMRMDITWVPQLASLKALQEVDTLDGFEDIKNNSFSGSLASCTWQGKYYGIPLDVNTQIAIYNKKDLEDAGLSSAPETFDELVSAAEKIKGTHKNGLIGIYGTGMWSMSPFFLSLGGKYCDDNYTTASGYINSQESIDALTKLVELNDKGLIGKIMLGGQPGGWEGLKASDGYMCVADGPWFFSSQDKSITDNYTEALIPSGSSGSISVVGGEDLVMFTNSKNKAAAWEFMKYMFSEYPQETMALKANQYPANATVASEDKLTSDPIYKIYVEQMKTAWSRIQSPANEEMDKDISLAFEKAFRHKGEVKDILDDLAKQLDALFAKYKS